MLFRSQPLGTVATAPPPTNLDHDVHQIHPDSKAIATFEITEDMIGNWTVLVEDIEDISGDHAVFFVFKTSNNAAGSLGDLSYFTFYSDDYDFDHGILGYYTAENSVTYVKILTKTPEDSNLILVSYDSSGKIVAVKKYQPTKVGVQDIRVDFDYSGAEMVRAFLWSNDFAPLSDAKDLPIN